MSVSKMNKKHVSRKLKSSWRKHIDTKDVDNFLEQQRQDERTGTFTEKPNIELFVEEKKPGRQKATLRDLRKRKFEEAPKCLLSLKNNSRVSDPIIKRNIKKTKIPVVLGARLGIKLRKTVRPTSVGEAGHEDLWANEQTLPKDLCSEWIEKEQVLHTLKNVGRPVVKLPGKMDTIDKIAAEVKKLPREGTSYNPAIDDYIELKNEVVAQERNIRKRKAHFDRVVTNMFTKITPEHNHRIKIQEMSEGLIKSENSDSDAETNSATEPTAVVAKRKKRCSKTKKREHLRKLYEESKVKEELRKLKDINRAEKINEELKKSEQEVAKKALKKASEVAVTDNLPIDFIEPELLSGSLRAIQPLKNLIATGLPKVRKISILKNSRAEAERKKSRPRKKVRYVRRSHKGQDD